MVLDEPKETDEVFKVNGFTMIIDKDLLSTTQDVTVDYINQGFRAGFQINCKVPISGGSGCGSSCKC